MKRAVAERRTGVRALVMPTGMPMSSSKKMPNVATVEGGGEALQDDGRHRELGLVAVAHVAVHEVPQVEAVLLARWAGRGPRLRRMRSQDLRRRVRAGDALGGVAGHGEGEQERDEAHEEEHHHHPEQPADDVLTHRPSCSPCAVPRSSPHLPSSFHISWNCRFQTWW